MGAKPSFGEQLTAFRARAGLTLRETARRAQVSPSYLSQLETGRMPTPPSEAALVRLAKVVGVSPFEMAAAAGRIPAALEAQVCSDPLWLHVLVQARLRKVPPAELLRFVEGYKKR